ncbi:unnamed protein product [Closterium sp. NIES-65]|nr:unnamed protein product [Closterium sp. NIES-65]
MPPAIVCCPSVPSSGDCDALFVPSTRWIGNFSRLQQLHTLLPYVPVSNPKLSPSTYEGVLVELLVSPHSLYHRQLPPTLARWPPALYNLGAVIVAAEKRLLQHGSAIQLQLLAGLYVRNRDFIEALDVYLRILVAQHRAHHSNSSAAAGLTDSHGRMANLAQAPAASADVNGDSQGRVTSHADVDGEQLHSPVKSPVNGNIAGKDAAGSETSHKDGINRRAACPSSEDHRRYPAQESNVSFPNESLTSAKWPGPDLFEFIREHRLVRHLLSAAPHHHHRLPSLFLIHPHRAAALLADHIAVAPPETVVRQLLGVDSPAMLGPPEPVAARQLSPRGSATLVDGAVNGAGDGEGSEVVLTGRERRMALHCYLHEVFERMPEVASTFHPMQVELYADFDRRLLLPFLQSSDYYPLQDVSDCKLGLVEEQVFLLTRMGDYKEALSLLLDRLKDVNRVAALMEQASDIFSPKQLLAGVAPNTYLKELRQHLLAVLAASATEVSLRQGCIALLQSECIDLLCLFILQSQFAARFSSSSSTAPPHLPLLPLPSSTMTAATSTLLSPYASPQATSGFFPGGAAGTSLLSLYSRKPFRRKTFIGTSAGKGNEGDESDLVGRAGQEEGKQATGEREERERRRKEKEEARAVALAFRQLEMGEVGEYGGMEGRGGLEGRDGRRGGGGERSNGLPGAVGSDSFFPSISQLEEEEEDEDEEGESDGEDEEDEVMWSEQWSSAPLFPASGGLKIATIAVEAGEGYRGDSRTGGNQVDVGHGGMGERGRGGLLRAWSEVFEGERGGIVGSKDGLRRAGSEMPRGKEEGMGEFDAQRGGVVRLEGRQEVQGNKLKRGEVEKKELLGGGPPRCCLCLDALHLHQQEIVCFFCTHAYHVPCLEVALKLGGRGSGGETGGAKMEGNNARLTQKPMDSTEKAGTREPGKQMRLGFVTGLVPKVKAATFERILFRATRGNMYLKQEELDEPVVDPATGEEIQDALHRAVTMSKADVGTIFQTIRSGESPPTYFKTNKFTGAFQGIIDAYGMARYREANPGVFTIITFPFLFAVMFGDWGHGILMLLASLWLVKNERKLGSQKLGDIMEMVYGGRYLILLMSIFSIYTGFVYNEFFAVAFDFAIFGGSAYTCRTPDCGDAASAGLVKTGNTYLFGVDPRWKGSRTELPFLNSLKMKMSIVLGVTHMFLGLALSLCNALFFDLPLNIWYEFIPQVLFLASLFGYLSLLIIVKWITASQADLYHVMIYMFLNPTEPLGENELFWGQGTLQHLKKRQGRAYAALNSDNELYEMEALHPGEEGQLHHHHHEEEFDFGEVMVHQMIHTIEFVLGAVSNTASYLRLWALSLAHAELSAVFFERVLLPAFESGNIIFIIIGFFVFASATVGVLLLMETLSAFLHALRLHWVEFMNKFYTGDGYKFLPFSFDTITDDEE